MSESYRDAVNLRPIHRRFYHCEQTRHPAAPPKTMMHWRLRCTFAVGFWLMGLALIDAVDAQETQLPVTQLPAQGKVAQDTVWITPLPTKASRESWYPGSIEILRGTVTQWNEKHLGLRTGPDSEDKWVASSRVIWMEPGRLSELEQKVFSAFEEGNFSAALSGLSPALKTRPPIWRQQWLTMLATNAAHRNGRSKIALELVAQLDRRPMPLMVIGWLPMDWSGPNRDRSSVSAALARIGDESPLTRLVAASWLISSSNRADAIATLRALTQLTERPHVKRLATCVLWATANPEQVKEKEIRWIKQLEALPMALSVGPSILLERKFRTAGLAESADAIGWFRQFAPAHPHPELMFE